MNSNWDDISGSFETATRILYSVPGSGGSELKQLDIASGVVSVLAQTPEDVVAVAYSGKGGVFAQVRSVTPNGHANFAVEKLSSGRLTAVLPPDESNRGGLVALGSNLGYVKTSSWIGDSGGEPWGSPYFLVELSQGKEKVLAEFGGSVDADGSSTWTSVYPIVVWPPDARGSELVLFDTKTTSSRAILGTLSPTSSNGAAMAPNGRTAAIPISDPGKGFTIRLVDLKSNRTENRSVGGRLIQVLYAPDGTLYSIVGEAGVGEASLMRWEKQWVKVATLR